MGRGEPNEAYVHRYRHFAAGMCVRHGWFQRYEAPGCPACEKEKDRMNEMSGVILPMTETEFRETVLAQLARIEARLERLDPENVRKAQIEAQEAMRVAMRPTSSELGLG